MDKIVIDSGMRNSGPFRRGKKMADYVSRMEKGDEKALFHDEVANILLEQGFTITEDPRSIYEPQQLYEGLARYGPKNNIRHKVDTRLIKGIDFATKVYAKPENTSFLRPLTKVYELTSALKLEKFSGLPMMTNKKDSFVYSYDREGQIRDGRKSPNPCLAGKRTQENNKTRLVWQYPMEMTIMEARFARPLIDKFINERRTTLAFGLHKYELGSYLSNLEYKFKTIYALDYSKFDSSISAQLIQTAFWILSTWFDQESKDEFGWEQIIKYFITTPIVMPNGNLYKGKKHGVPSGSYFTQLIDSIVNTILIGMILFEFKQEVHWKNVFVLGDDCIFPMFCRIPLDRISQLLKEYGINLNMKKSEIGRVHFLGAEWHKGFPDTSEAKIISRLVNPETFRKRPPTISSREFAISVICSMSTSYLSAGKMLPNFFSRGNYLAYDIRGPANPKFLTGGARFILEHSVEVGKIGRAHV